MSQLAKCFEVRTPEGKLLADLRIYDVSVVEKEAPVRARTGSQPRF